MYYLHNCGRHIALCTCPPRAERPPVSNKPHLYRRGGRWRMLSSGFTTKAFVRPALNWARRWNRMEGL